MTKRESIYLDLVRALAAVVVVIDHAPAVFTVPGGPRWGHQAVIVFYVLSGYVIAAAADKAGTTTLSFMTARLARLWSVLIPALVLTVVCDNFGRMFGVNPAAYDTVPGDLIPIRLGAAVVFLSESWVSIQPLSDGVIWSLCAEFWYYALFAVWTFTPVGRRRTWLVLIALISGFKAILLVPIWLFGVVLYRSTTIRRLPDQWNSMLFASSTVMLTAILCTQFYNVPIAATEGMVPPWLTHQLAQVRVFWFDWLFGLLVFAHFLSARGVVQRIPIERFERPIRWCASISFAAYLFHVPLEHLLAAFIPGLNGWVAVAITIAIISVLGPPAERSKRWWARQIQATTQAIRPSPKPDLTLPAQA